MRIFAAVDSAAENTNRRRGAEGWNNQHGGGDCRRLRCAPLLAVAQERDRAGGSAIRRADDGTSDIYGDGVEEVFGFREVRHGRDHYELRLAVGAPLLEEFTDPAEQVLPPGNHAKNVRPIAAWSYSETKEPPLARYEDGSAAITRRSYEAVIMTHDIDAQTSMANAVQYAQFEKSQGIVGTYFVQTKYIKDFNDEVFLNDQGINMAALHRLGMELGSHTVAHSKVFSHFPLGTGTERFPEYQPYVKTRTKAANGSVFGELRVSKHLIEQLSGGANILSFRPGELSNPKTLP